MSDSDKDPEEGAAEEKTEESSEESKDESSSEESSEDEKREESSDGDSSDDGDSDDDDSDDDGSDDDDSDDGDEEEDDDEGSSSASLLIGVLAIAAGFGIGWFGHDYQVQKELKKADAAVQGEGEGARGPCKDWETAICAEFPDPAFPCGQAKAASGLLSGSACEQAITGIKGSIAAIKAARAPCDNLATKLCEGIGPETKTCEMVKTETPKFPLERCTEMEKNFDQVLTGLQNMEKRGGPRPPGPPGARPPGHPGGRGPGPGPVRVSPPGAKPPGAPTASKPAPPKAPAPKPPAPKAPAPKAPAPAP